MATGDRYVYTDGINSAIDITTATTTGATNIAFDADSLTTWTTGYPKTVIEGYEKREKCMKCNDKLVCLTNNTRCYW